MQVMIINISGGNDRVVDQSRCRKLYKIVILEF